MTESVITEDVRTRATPLAFDESALRAASESRTVAASLSSDAPLIRWGEVEVLSHETGAVDLSRAEGGSVIPLLVGHDDGGIPIGTVESLRLDGGRLRGVLRFATSARAEEALQAVREGVLTATSVRYRVRQYEAIFEDGQRVGSKITRWELLEVSLVAVPFDPTVGVGRSLTKGNRMGIDTAATESRTEEQTRTEDRAAIEELCCRHALGDEFRRSLLAEPAITLDQARARVLDELVRSDRAAGGHVNVRSADAFVYPRAGDPETVMRAMAEGLAARYGGPAPSDRAREYVGLSVLSMAREALELRGIRTSHMSTSQIYERSLTTSDLATLLTGTGQRLLQQSYSAYAGGIRQIARQSTARDFRAKTIARLGEAPALQKVNEHGEFKFGGMAEAAETYRLSTYGRIVAVSRQAIVNDDLGAFADMANKQGQAAMEAECALLVELLTANSGVGPTMADGKALFHADHGNLATTGSALTAITPLSAGRKAMRLQTGLDGATPIDVRPKFIVVPAALETAAEQLVATITPAVVEEVNPFAGKLIIVVDPRLDAISTTAWYLAADPMQLPTIEYSYLEDALGPQMFVDEGFEIDGVRFKVRLDYGCGVLDWRGLYSATGAA